MAVNVLKHIPLSFGIKDGEGDNLFLLKDERNYNFVSKNVICSIVKRSWDVSMTGHELGRTQDIVWLITFVDPQKSHVVTDDKNFGTVLVLSHVFLRTKLFLFAVYLVWFIFFSLKFDKRYEIKQQKTLKGNKLNWTWKLLFSIVGLIKG